MPKSQVNSTLMTRPQPVTNTNQEGKIEVKVVQIGQEPQVVRLEEGANVNKALEAAGLKPGKELQIKVNGRKANGETVLKQGDIVVLVTKFSQGY